MQYGKTNWGGQYILNIIRTAFLLNVSNVDLFLPFANICHFVIFAEGS